MAMINEPLMPTGDLVKKFNLETFVETGCLYGHGLEFANAANLKMYTCDIVEQWAVQCKEKFPEATVKFADSLTFLRELLPTLGNTRTLFWLDAHFPVKYGELAGDKTIIEDEITRFPEFQEMELIKQLKTNYQNDVIMMDDVWCIDDGENELYGHHIDSESYRNHSVKEFKAIFADTHDCQLIEQYSGILIFTPKIIKYRNKRSP